jgi:hypothetical protein
MDMNRNDAKGFLYRLRNRRQFLWLAAGTTLGLGALPVLPVWASDGAAPDDFQPIDTPPDFVAGTVESLKGDALIMQARNGQNLLLESSQNVQLYSGIYGRVASLRQFIVGDRIGALGFLAGTRLTAVRAGSIFTPADVTIHSVGVNHQVAVSDGGPMNLSRINLPDVGTVGMRAVQITAGQRLSVLIWTHPQTKTAYVAAASMA